MPYTLHRDELIKLLRFLIPQFEVGMVVVNLLSVLPHRRSRFWVRGLRKGVLANSQLSSIPAPLRSFGTGPPALCDV